MLADLGRAFSSTTRAKGERYYVSGRVSLLSTDAAGLTAHVSGTIRYDVTLQFAEPQVLGTCTCPHCLDGYPCKHLWATLLSASEQGRLPAYSRAIFELDFDAIDDGFLMDAVEIAPLDSGTWPRDLVLATPGIAGRPGSSAPRRREPAPPRWIDHLNAATALRTDATIALPAREERVLYRIDVDRTLADGTLMLQLLANILTRRGE